MELRGNQIRHQLTPRTGYTFSKTTDNASEIFATFGAGNSQTFSQSQVNFTGTEHGNSGIDLPHTFFASFTEELPMFRAQHGVIGHILGGWAIGASYYISSGQPYTPVQFALNGGGPDYDNAFVNAFYGTVDQALRPFAANPSAPVNQVGIYAGDELGCDNVATACPAGITPTTLISLNQFNIDGSAKPVTSKDVRFIANTPTANTIFNSPFGNVGRNTLRDAWTNIGNFTLFKSVTIRENLKAQFHATMQNVFIHPNYSSIDPFLDDAGLHSETTGFADPTVFSGGLQNGTVGNPGRKIAFGLTIRF